MLNSKWVKVEAISSQGALQETNNTLEKLKADIDSFTRAVISSQQPAIIAGYFTHEMTPKVYIPIKSDQDILFPNCELFFQEK